MLSVQMVPGLSDDDIRHLGAICHRLPYTVRLVSGVLAIQHSVDTETLIESLSVAATHPALAAIEADIEALLGQEDHIDNGRQMRSIAVGVLGVLYVLDQVRRTPHSRHRHPWC